MPRLKSSLSLNRHGISSATSWRTASIYADIEPVVSKAITISRTPILWGVTFSKGLFFSDSVFYDSSRIVLQVSVITVFLLNKSLIPIVLDFL